MNEGGTRDFVELRSDSSSEPESLFAGSNGELERPRRSKESALRAQNTDGAHSAPPQLSRPLQALVSRLSRMTGAKEVTCQ